MFEFKIANLIPDDGLPTPLLTSGDAVVRFVADRLLIENAGSNTPSFSLLLSADPPRAFARSDDEVFELVLPPARYCGPLLSYFLTAYPPNPPPALIHGQPWRITASQSPPAELGDASQGVTIAIEPVFDGAVNKPPEGKHILPDHRYSPADLLVRNAVDILLNQAVARELSSLTLMTRSYGTLQHLERRAMAKPIDCQDAEDIPPNIGGAVADYLLKAFASADFAVNGLLYRVRVSHCRKKPGAAAGDVRLDFSRGDFDLHHALEKPESPDDLAVGHIADRIILDALQHETRSLNLAPYIRKTRENALTLETPSGRITKPATVVGIAGLVASYLLKRYPPDAPPTTVHGRRVEVVVTPNIDPDLPLSVSAKIDATPLSETFDLCMIRPGHDYSPDDLFIRIAAASVLGDAVESNARTLTLRPGAEAIRIEYKAGGLFARPTVAAELPSSVGRALIAYLMGNYAQPRCVILGNAAVAFHATAIPNGHRSPTTGVRIDIRRIPDPTPSFSDSLIGTRLRPYLTPETYDLGVEKLASLIIVQGIHTAARSVTLMIDKREVFILMPLPERDHWMVPPPLAIAKRLMSHWLKEFSAGAAELVYHGQPHRFVAREATANELHGAERGVHITFPPSEDFKFPRGDMGELPGVRYTADDLAVRITGMTMLALSSNAIEVMTLAVTQDAVVPFGKNAGVLRALGPCGASSLEFGKAVVSYFLSTYGIPRKVADFHMVGVHATPLAPDPTIGIVGGVRVTLKRLGYDTTRILDTDEDTQ